MVIIVSLQIMTYGNMITILFVPSTVLSAQLVFTIDEVGFPIVVKDIRPIATDQQEVLTITPPSLQGVTRNIAEPVPDNSFVVTVETKNNTVAIIEAVMFNTEAVAEAIVIMESNGESMAVSKTI